MSLFRLSSMVQCSTSKEYEKTKLKLNIWNDYLTEFMEKCIQIIQLK